MERINKQLTYQHVLTSKRIALPLTLVLGFASGLLSAGCIGIKVRYELVPAEIVVAPPPPNASWCFPDVAFTGAEKFRKNLTKQLSATQSAQYSDTMLNRSMESTIQQDELGREGYYQLNLLAVTPQHFAVIAMPHWEADPSRYTLLTEQGYFYLYAIPKRRHEKYDSLASARLGYQN